MGLHLYLGFKLLHVLAVVLFLGNITTGVFWKANADRTRNPVVIANMLEGIIRADRLFTISGIAFMAVVGPAQRKMLALVRRSGESLDWAAYRALSVQWEIWGAIALLAPAIAAALMVMKPAIPGLGALLGR